MKLQLFVLCCALQSIYGFDESDYITATRVRGGEDAPDGVTPSQCSLQLNRRHFCDCSIIDDQYILTASHCIVGQSAGSLEVLVGSNDLSKGGKYYKVAKLTAHEHYSSPRFAYDIAVIKLQEKVEFNNKVQKIELGKEEGEIIKLDDVETTGCRYIHIKICA